MKKFLKIFLILLVLLVIGIGIFLWTFDLNAYRGYIENKISVALGRTVKVGSLDMKLSLIPTIQVRDIQVLGDKSVFADKPLAEVDSGEITLSLLPLLSRRLEVQNVAFNTLNVNVISKNGRKNWQSEISKEKDIQSAKEEFDVRLDSLSVSNVNISYQDDNGEKIYVGRNFSLKQMKVFSLNAEINAIPFKVSGTIDSLWDFIMEKPDYLFNIEFDGAGLLAKFSGSIGDPRTFKNLLLNVDISGMNLKKTVEVIGISNKIYPTQPFNVSAVMQGDLSELTVSKLDITLGGSKLKGALTGLISDPIRSPSITLGGNINLSDRALSHFWGLNPLTANLSFVLSQDALLLNNLSVRAERTDIQVSGKITEENDKVNAVMNVVSEYFDIQDIFFSEEMFYTQERNPYAPNRKIHLIEDKPIDLGFLNEFNAVVSVRAPHLTLSEKLRGYLGVNGTFVLKDGILSARPLNLTILDSDVTGELRLSARDNSYYLKLEGENLQLSNIRDLSKSLRDAKADIALDLSGYGKTVKEILSSLNGQVLVDMSQGVIVNDWFNDLAEKLNEKRKFAVSRSTTDRESKIVCGALKATIENGQIIGENNIALETSTINLVVGGGVDLPSEMVDLTVIPSLNSEDLKLGNILKTVGRFIKIKGPFSDLKPVISMDNTLQNIVGLFNNRPYQEYQVCQQVLGRATKAQQLEIAKQMQVLPKPTKPQIVQEQPKDNSFKQLLMDSLEEALQ